MDISGPERWRIIRIGGLNAKGIEDGAIATSCRDARIIYEGIKPHVGDEILVKWNWNPPVEPRRGTRDAQVFERVVLQKTQDFIATIRWLHKVGMILNVINEPGLMRLEFKIVILFLEPDDFTPGRIESAVWILILLREKGFLFQ